MCFSLQASLVTSMWCLGCAVVVAARNASSRDAWAARLLAALGAVQLCDVMLWMDAAELPEFVKGHPRTTFCSSTNNLVSQYLLPMALTEVAMTQVFKSIDAVKVSATGRPLSSWVQYVHAAMVLTAPWRFHLYWGAPPYCTSLLNKRTLLWADIPAPTSWLLVGTLSISLPFLAMKPHAIGFLYAVVGMYSSILVSQIAPEAWGSNWCFVASILSVLFLIEPYVTEHVTDK